MGYVSLQGLIDGSISIKTFFEALKLVDFENWISDNRKKPTNDQVEYFD